MVPTVVRSSVRGLILFLHNRYRVPGGEERVVADQQWLVREHLGEEAELLERDSAALGAARSAAGLLRGGLDPDDVGRAVRRTGARVVHAHNLWPAFGPRALAAAREAGARVVLQLHNYRLVCAVGTCVTPAGTDCTRCHGRDTRPGVRLNCRGDRREGVVYAAALAAHSARMVERADAVVVPSQAALDRLRALGAPLPPEVHVVPHVLRGTVERSTAAEGSYALVVSRLAPDKAVDLAVDACREAGIALRVAGDGPELAALRDRARGADVTFLGRLDDVELARQRAGAALALVPTRAEETYGLAAVEAMAAGLPVVATARGALNELPVDLVAPEDAPAMARAARAAFAHAQAGERALEAARDLADPAAGARRLRALYDA